MNQSGVKITSVIFVHAIFYFLMFGFTLAIAPRMIETLEEFGIELASLSVSAIEICNFFMDYWYVLILPCIFHTAAISFVVTRVKTSLSWAGVLIGSSLPMIGVFLFTLLFLLIPALQTTNALTQ